MLNVKEKVPPTVAPPELNLPSGMPCVPLTTLWGRESAATHLTVSPSAIVIESCETGTDVPQEMVYVLEDAVLA